MKKKFNLRKQFVVKNNKKEKYFDFDAKTNKTTSYRVSYHECDSNETNAWIVISKAVKKNHPKLLLD